MTDKRKLPDLEENGQAPRKRVMGPSLPPQTDHDSSQSESESESDDDFGPSLPPPQGASPIPSQPQHQPNPPKPTIEKKEARDQWMVEPPAHGDWASKVDPTQLRNRKFQGKSNGSGASKQLDASWVESPEERLRRLGDQVMGVATSTDPKQQSTSTADAARAASMEEKIQKFNEQTRKKPRLESQAKAGKDEDDDPSIRAFDREKDMAISSRISNAQRREMVNKASDYSTRFTKGNFL